MQLTTKNMLDMALTGNDLTGLAWIAVLNRSKIIFGRELLPEDTVVKYTIAISKTNDAMPRSMFNQLKNGSPIRHKGLFISDYMKVGISVIDDIIDDDDDDIDRLV